jgi:hypothetical protein
MISRKLSTIDSNGLSAAIMTKYINSITKNAETLYTKYHSEKMNNSHEKIPFLSKNSTGNALLHLLFFRPSKRVLKYFNLINSFC